MSHQWRLLPRVLPYVRPYSGLALATLVLLVLSAAAALLQPWPLAFLVDGVLAQRETPGLVARFFGEEQSVLIAFAVIAGLVVTFLSGALGVLTDYVNTKLEQNMILDFRSDLFDHAQGLSMAYHDNARTGSLMYKINNQSSSLGQLVMLLPPLLQSAVTLTGMFVVVFRVHSHLALLSLSVVPFIYYCTGYYTRRIEPRLRHVRNMEGRSLSIVHEAMAMLRVIVAFGREEHEYRRFRRQAQRTVDARVNVTLRQTVFSMAVSVVTAAGTALVLAYGAYAVIRGEITVGELLVVMSYIAQVYKPLEDISSTLATVQEKFIGVELAFGLLDTQPGVMERPDARHVTRVRGKVEFAGVDFDYEGREGTLRDISFTAEPGEVVGIVGATGAGKSTLVSLLPRFADPKRGKIMIDGRDIRGFKLKPLRKQMSVVHQEPLLFRASIAQNIRYGKAGATNEDVEEASKAANAHDFIVGLPQGYDTRLGERGAQISGGERQRISIARAFLKDAPILILDEPTSSVDSKTEEVILDALDRLMEGRTTFVIAHRLSTLRRAAHILVLDHGRIVEQGAHDELLALYGLYRQFSDAQSGAGRRPVTPHDASTVAHAEPAAGAGT